MRVVWLLFYEYFKLCKKAFSKWAFPNFSDFLYLQTDICTFLRIVDLSFYQICTIFLFLQYFESCSRKIFCLDIPSPLVCKNQHN